MTITGGSSESWCMLGSQKDGPENYLCALLPMFLCTL